MGSPDWHAALCSNVHLQRRLWVYRRGHTGAKNKTNDGTNWLVGKGDCVWNLLNIEERETRLGIGQPDFRYTMFGFSLVLLFCSEEFHGLAIVYIAGLEHELSVRARRFPIHPRPRFSTPFLQTTEGTFLNLSSQLSFDEASAFRKVWVLIRLWKQHSVQARTNHEARTSR